MSDYDGEKTRHVVMRFLARYLEDREAGTVHPLAHYLELFPGHDEALAREFVRERTYDRAESAAEAGEDDLPDIDAPGKDQPSDRLGPYQLGRELGRGGQAVVYLAEDVRLHRQVALKVLTHLGPDSIELLQRFRREAEAASRIDHPGICAVYDTGVEGTTAWIAMRYVEGESLARRIQAARESGAPEGLSGQLSVEEITNPEEPKQDRDSPPTAHAAPDPEAIRHAVRLIEKIARALHVAHEARIIHRDIKPGNIMVTPQGEPVILDFGLAQEIDGTGPALTRTGDLFGTPHYMSPEQIAAQRVRLDRRTDVYSLGVVLYECLTLRRPFEATTREGLYQAILAKDPPDVRRLNPAIPKDLLVIVETALDKDRDRRYQTALDLAEDLRRLLSHEPIAARPAGVIEKFRRWIQRNPAVASLVLAVVFTLMAGLAVSLVQWRRAEDERERAESFLDRLTLGAIQTELPARVDQLWPAIPEKLPEMDAWLADVERILARVPEYEREAVSLRDATGDPSHEPGSPRRRMLTGTLDAAPRLRDALDVVRARRAFAASVDRLTLIECRDTWTQVLEEVADPARSPHYRGLKLEPIRGLIPLGCDPHSKLQEFHHPQTGTRPRRNERGVLEITSETGLVMVLVPGGSFVVGLQSDDPTGANWKWKSVPLPGELKRVDVAPYLISKFEMTQNQWLRIAGVNPSLYAPGRTPTGTGTAGGRVITGRNPVEQVSWEEAMRILGRIEMTLPAEDAWEFAAREGEELHLPWSEVIEVFKTQANLADLGSAPHYPPGVPLESGFEDGHAVHAPVGSFAPNGFGLFDMLGNVAEMCRDPYTMDRSARSQLRPGTEASDGTGQRMLRGGSFLDVIALCHPAARDGIGTQARNPKIGLRPARELPRQ